MRRLAGLAPAVAGFVLALSAGASAAWLSSGQGSGSGSATAAQVTPSVSISCTWVASTKLLSVHISWTKASYAQSTVVRVAALDGSTFTVASALPSGTTSVTDSATLGSAPKAGTSAITPAYAFNVTAFAGTYWQRTGTSGNRIFTYTTGLAGKNPTPDTCVVS